VHLKQQALPAASFSCLPATLTLAVLQRFAEAVVLKVRQVW
jgi:hypothetical protein